MCGTAGASEPLAGGGGFARMRRVRAAAGQIPVGAHGVSSPPERRQGLRELSVAVICSTPRPAAEELDSQKPIVTSLAARVGQVDPVDRGARLVDHVVSCSDH
jgi:hypothetical protein